MKCDAVFEGGGVNGVGLCGAVAVTEAMGYEFNRVAGTSAGSIVAALIAGGYDANTISDIVSNTNYQKFCDKGAIDRIPVLGPVLSILFENGFYEGDYFLNWMRGHLERSPSRARTFGDLIKREDGGYPLQMIATDISRRKMLIFPGDIAEYGIDPDAFEIALAVRMSMSVPVFFETVCLHHSQGPCHIVDGGVLSNYPVWLFDRKDNLPPRWPTFGFKLEDFRQGLPIDHYSKISGPIDLCMALVNTMLDAHDARAMEASERVRTIHIDTMGNSFVNFGMDNATRDRLYDSGAMAAAQFFKKWDFENYINEFRRNDHV